jgi:hypothetical protein
MRRENDSSASALEIGTDEDLTIECTTVDSRRARLSWFEEAGPENNLDGICKPQPDSRLVINLHPNTLSDVWQPSK